MVTDEWFIHSGPKVPIVPDEQGYKHTPVKVPTTISGMASYSYSYDNYKKAEGSQPHPSEKTLLKE